MIVVDTNLIVYLYLEGDFSVQAEKVFQSDPTWAAPWLWRSEFRNVLAFYLRKKIVAYESSLEIIAQAEKLMLGHEYSVVSSQVMELVQASQCSAYDCEFVCLAQTLQIPLVTADKKILSAFPDISVAVTDFK